jgi:hypothetical protein
VIRFAPDLFISDNQPMNAIAAKPAENQMIIYQAGFHWAILLGPAFLIFMSWLSLKSPNLPTGVLFTCGFIWGIFSYHRLRQSEILLTNNQLIVTLGFPLKRSYTIPLDTITFANFYQPTLGAILNFGKIIIVHRETQKTVFRFVARPAEFVKQIQEIIMTTCHHEQPLPLKTD